MTRSHWLILAAGLLCVALFVAGAKLVVDKVHVRRSAQTGTVTQVGGPPLPADQILTTNITCVRNLKQLSLAFTAWAQSHNGQYPFSVTSSSGGSKETSTTTADGYLENPVACFLALTEQDELKSPVLLVCPQDKSKTVAAKFASLTQSNVTYRVHSEAGVDMANPRQVLLACPVDGNAIWCDGNLFPAKQK